MRLNGRRESENVEDRRGQRSGGMAGLGGLGIGGIIIAALVSLFMGINPLEVLQNVDPSSLNVQEQAEGGREFTAEEQELATFSKQILAGTEDVWTELFEKMGRTYQPPKMVLYTGATRTACGNGSAAMGPFYCSGDQTVYIDLSFFSQMRQQLGADGDFSYAYVIAHEVGHHVQYLLGTLDKAHQKMAQVSKAESNQISIRLELQADFYAGVWAHHDNKMFNSIEDGDIEEGLNCAGKIGDDYLQKKAQGYTQPETFNHGTSQQRTKWLKRGLSTGDINQGNTFQYAFNDL